MSDAQTDKQTTAEFIPVPDPAGPDATRISYLRATIWAAMMEIENGMSDLAFYRLKSAFTRTALMRHIKQALESVQNEG